MKNILLLIGCVIIMGCDYNDTSYCGAAQANLQALCTKDPVKNSYCCAIVAPTTKGTTFSQVCQDVQNSSVYVNPRGLSTLTDCSQIDAISRTKKD